MKNSNSTKTHYRTRFKHCTQPKHVQHISQHNAFRGDSPVTSAEARHHRGNNWGVPRCRSTTDSLGSEAPPVQKHHGLLGTPLISKLSVNEALMTTNKQMNSTNITLQPNIQPKPETHTHTYSSSTTGKQTTTAATNTTRRVTFRCNPSVYTGK